MDCVDEELTVLVVLASVWAFCSDYLFVIFFNGFDEILFQKTDDFFDVSACYHLHRNLQRFITNIDIGTNALAQLKTKGKNEERTRRISITRSSNTPSCASCNSLTLSRTISLTLLSDSLMASSMNFEAEAVVNFTQRGGEPLIAAGLLVRFASEFAAS